MCFGAYEMIQMQKKWTYYNRFYPEATELQKSLEREAFSFKESPFVEKSTEERMAITNNPSLKFNYERFYSLGP